MRIIEWTEENMHGLAKWAYLEDFRRAGAKKREKNGQFEGKIGAHGGQQGLAPGSEFRLGVVG